MKDNNIKKKVFLHIGTHKTGTTTIQRKLQDNKNELMKEGFAVIAIPNKLKGLMTISDSKDIDTYTEQLQDIVEKETNNDLDIIASWEGFSGNYYKGYDNSHLIAKVVRNCFPQDLYDVKVVVYLRAQDSFIESLYTQEIHAGGDSKFEGFCSKINVYHDFDWTKLVNNYSDEFGCNNLIVKTYSRERLNKVGGLLSEFSAIINSNVLKNITEIKNENVGFNQGALELARKVNKVLNPEQRKQLRSLLHSISEPKDYSFFSSDEREKIVEEYDELNKSIFSSYNVIDNIDLFNRNIEKEICPEDELSAITKIILKMAADNEIERKAYSQCSKELTKNNAELVKLRKEINELSNNLNSLKKSHSNLLNYKVIKFIAFIEMKIKRMIKISKN